MIKILAAALAVALAALVAGSVLLAGDGKHQATQASEIEATQISAADFSLVGRSAAFKRLRFVGGLVLRSTNPNFGALSGLRVTNDGTLTAVTDTGFWFRGKIERGSDGRPLGISSGRMAPLLDGDGNPFSQKWFGDAEGLTFMDGAAYVSTEQDARIIRYPTGDDLLLAKSSTFGPGVPNERLPYNRGLEALAKIPAGHAFAGRLLAISEAPADHGDNIRAFIWGDTAVQEFEITPLGGFYITDADFTPDGNLLLLERRFSPADGAAMRLRLIDGAAVEPNVELSGDILLDLDRSWQIDNMEGLSVFAAPDGSTRIGIVSDDNKWPLQRTLYLEFKLEN